MNDNPIAANDIELFNMYSYKDDKYLLGSKEKDRYVIVNKEKGTYYLNLLHDLDGSLSILQLADKWGMSLEQVHHIIDSFYDKGLLYNSLEKNDNTEVNRLSKKIITIECNLLKNFSKKMSHHIVIAFLLLLGILVVFDLYMLFAGQVNSINIFKLNNSYILSLVLSSLIMIPSFLFHELCHSIVALKYGLKPSKIDICLYLYLFPLYYVKIKGLYTIYYKKRIIIMSAGIIGNVFLAVIMLALYIIFRKGIFLTVVLSQFNIILANINPFSLSDGYYIMTMIFKTENLRKNMFDIIANLNFKKYRSNRKLFFYIIINLLIIAFNVMYISKYSYNVICELFDRQLSTWIIPIGNVLLLLFYILVVHIRFKEKKFSNGEK